MQQSAEMIGGGPDPDQGESINVGGTRSTCARLSPFPQARPLLFFAHSECLSLSRCDSHHHLCITSTCALNVPKSVAMFNSHAQLFLSSSVVEFSPAWPSSSSSSSHSASVCALVNISLLRSFSIRFDSLFDLEV